MDSGILALNEKIKQESAFLSLVKSEIRKVIIGQDYLVDRMLISMLANGHLLVEGVPGLAKTLAIKTLSQTISTDFKRIQFTPDLLPADIVGTLVFNPKSGEYTTKKGPIFSNIILADEINRAPAKVQSALLEAMQERQVTIGDETFSLPEPFMVLATMNPVEQEGTYQLPEAQVDRFMLKVKVGYLDRKEEHQVLKRMAKTQTDIAISAVVKAEDILRARKAVDQIYMDEKIEEYILDIVYASRKPRDYKLPELEDLILYGASPRATLALTLAAKANAFINGRGYVTPLDIKTIGMDVLRHRIIPTYEAEAENMTGDDIVKKIFDEIAVP